MIIEHRPITVRELIADFEDKGEGGVKALGGTLDVRPPYQREFIYNIEQRRAVINSVMNGFPLNVLYFADRTDGTFEVMDGQQRIMSLCQFVDGAFSYEMRYFNNLSDDEKEKILDYELFVYFCSGTDSEKLSWFETINIAGEKLTHQELRNAVYHDPWLADAKKWFSRTGGAAAKEGDGYVSGTPIRQELLEKALQWICLRDGMSTVEEYMALNQHSPNASDLWDYYRRVIGWSKSTFPYLRKEMKSVNWGQLYHQHGSTFPDGHALELQVSKLMADEDVTKKSGIYPYVLDGKEKHLNLRTFSPNQKREAYERQMGICAMCNEHFALQDMEGDHIIPWSQGGKTEAENCQMLCIEDNRRKSNR